MSSAVPSGWSKLRLGDLSGLVTKGTTPKLYCGEGVNFVKVESVSGNATLIPSKFSHIDVATHESLKRSQLKNGDILFSIAGSLGRLALVNKEHLPANTNQALAIIRLRKDSINPMFCIQQLRGEMIQTEIMKLQTVGAQPNLSLQQISDILLITPPVLEQQKIAAILSSVDDVIEKTQAQIDKLKDLKTGMMQELLTKGIGHTEFKELSKWTTGKIAEIEKIPKSWELVNILSVAKLESGHTPSRDKSEYWGGEFQWVSLHDTKQLEIPVVHETKLTITQDGLDNSSARLLPIGTVAFSRTASVGHCVIFGREMATSQDFANYICGEKLLNRYLLHLFRWMQHVWSNIAEGSTHKTIYMPTFKKLQILLPPIDEQIRISGIADKIDDDISVKRQKLAAIKNIKKALMQDLLTGKVRVTVDH